MKPNMRVMWMRPIAISGKMCSGKSTLLKLIQSKEPSYERVSLGDPVKEVARNYFLMPKGVKDRPLLQQIGQRFRTINPNVWVDLLHAKADSLIAENKIPICDDVRFPNELNSMISRDWTIIRLHITEDEQKKRLKGTYGADWESHWDNRKEESETSLDHMDNGMFHYVLEKNNRQELDKLVDAIFTCD